MIKVNLNLVVVLAIVAVVSVPIAYALVESSIVINMLPSQTTKPLQIKDSFGTDVFSVDTSGTIFPVQGGGEVFTWTADHSSGNNNLILGTGILQFGSTDQKIFDQSGDMHLKVASTEGFIFEHGGITEFQFFGTGNGNQFALTGQNSITWNTDGHDITPSATDLTINVGTVNDRINLRTFDTDRFTINGQNAQISVPFDFNSNAITEAVINCSLNTCTNFPSSPTSYTVFGSRFANLNPTNNFFNFPSGQSDAIGNETEMVMTMTTSGTIDRLFFKYITNGLDIPTTVTVRKNFADTSLTLSNPASSNAVVSNVVNSFTFVSGDEISINFVVGAGTGTGTKPNWSFEITQ